MTTQSRYHSTRFFTPATWIILLLLIIGAGAALYRMGAGLGPATNLSDGNPWGLWITFDVLTGVALAAGGFTITCAVYILNWKKYKPITRAATLTAFLGYLLVMIGLFLDIGKPWSFWHAWVFWQPHSVMFEIVVCLTLYFLVLLLEFLPWLLTKFKSLKRLQGVLESRVVILPLVIAGILLSYGHQSSLGGLFLITPDRLHPLWSTPMLHNLFFLSAICAGLAIVSIETMLSSNAFGKEPESDILEGLGQGTAIALLVYTATRMIDLGVRGNIPFIFEGSGASQLFLFEFGICAVLPMIFLTAKTIRTSFPSLMFFQGLVLLGVIFYRFNVVLSAQQQMGGTYFPSLVEIAVTVGLVAGGIFLYRLAVTYLPIFSPAEHSQ